MKVINGTLTEKLDKEKNKRNFLENKYYELYNNFLYGYENEPNKEKAVFYGIKYVSKVKLAEKDFRELLLLYSIVKDIMLLMEQIPLKTIINMFPIIKEYDGKRFECKDYYSTLDYLKNKKMDEPLGDEIHMFFFEYYNNDIMNFSIKQILLLDQLRKYQNQQSIFEDFLDTINKDKSIHTYTIHKKEGYIYDNMTGKTMKITEPKKKIPKYLKRIK